jgi:hypothetical protein
MLRCVDRILKQECVLEHEQEQRGEANHGGIFCRLPFGDMRNWRRVQLRQGGTEMEPGLGSMTLGFSVSSCRPNVKRTLLNSTLTSSNIPLSAVSFVTFLPVAQVTWSSATDLKIRCIDRAQLSSLIHIAAILSFRPPIISAAWNALKLAEYQTTKSTSARSGHFAIQPSSNGVAPVYKIRNPRPGFHRRLWADIQDIYCLDSA